MDFTIPVDYRVKLIESEKIDKYLDLARELKRPSNMRVMVISVGVDALKTIPKDMEKRLEELVVTGRIKTI